MTTRDVLCIPKPQKDAEGNQRVVVDLRELNEKCVKTGKPLPSIERIFDNIPRDDTVFTILDLTDGFHQCPLTAESTQYIGIVLLLLLLFGKFEFLVTPQGFTNSPGEFQERIYNLLEKARCAGRISKTVQQFIDDILISAPDIPTLFKRTNEVLDELWTNGLQILPLKCQFGALEVSFLGFIISKDGKSLGKQLLDDIETKVEQTITFYTMNQNVVRRNPKDWIQSLLGILNFYRQFLRNFATSTAFLTNKLRKHHSTEMTIQDTHLIHDLIKQLRSAGCVALISFDHNTDIYTDASDIGAGFIALQDGKIVAMDSAKFKSKVISEATIDRELSAIDLMIAKLNDRIDWRKTVIHTDHQPLISLLDRHKNNDLTLHGRRLRVIFRINATGCTIRYHS